MVSSKVHHGICFKASTRLCTMAFITIKSFATMNLIQKFLRTILLIILAVFGLLMASIFMFSTLLAIAVLYVIARIQGRPFGVKAYWAERRRANMPGHARSWSNSWQTSKDGQSSKPDVVDIEMREIP